MNLTDWLALYGAVTATGSALWGWYTWRHSNHLRLTGTANGNMTMFDDFSSDETTYMMVTIQNRGSVPTTVKMVVMCAYKNRFDWIRGKTSFTAIVKHSGNFGHSLPYFLDKAGEFSSIVRQTEDVEKMSRDALLYVGITHTMKNKPFYVRVKPIRVVEQEKNLKRAA
jgi:hypothetical protein